MPTTAPTRLSLAWWIVLFGLSAYLSLNGVLPLLHAGAGEYTPFHQHVLVGGTAAERAWLLDHHLHGLLAARATPTPTPAAASDTPTLTTTGSSLLDLLSLAAGGAALLATFDWPQLRLPLAVWVLLLPLALFRLGHAAPPPERPPRPA